MYFQTSCKAALPGLPNQTGTVDVYGLPLLDATLETGNTAEAALGAAEHSSLMEGQQRRWPPELDHTAEGFQLEGYAMTLSAFAWNLCALNAAPERRH